MGVYIFRTLEFLRKLVCKGTENERIFGFFNFLAKKPLTIFFDSVRLYRCLCRAYTLSRLSCFDK